MRLIAESTPTLRIEETPKGLGESTSFLYTAYPTSVLRHRPVSFLSRPDGHSCPILDHWLYLRIGFVRL
jgi:hypothetical protein